jgi:hypothetical protein
MEGKDILYSKGKNDECFTLDYGVEPILKYIPKGAVVWCPFDKSDSEFVKQISKQNTVVHSHIDTGQDFFNYEPDIHWDIIVSNPPFSGKRKFFEKALSFNKPFALLAPLTWLSDAAPKQLFKDKDLQLLMFDKRMKFMNNGEIQNKITFSTAYYCWNFLPKQIIMEELKIK